VPRAGQQFEQYVTTIAPFHNFSVCLLPISPVRTHQTLRVTPAMEAGIADHVWSLDEVIALLK